MAFIFTALLGYFFNAVASIFDKYLLADHIKAPAVYAFYVALLSLFALFFIPFGFHFFGWQGVVTSFFSGVLFLYSLIALYTAFKDNEVSRVAPLVGTVTSVTAFVYAFLVGYSLEKIVFLSLLFLILGGFLIAFDLPLKKNEHIPFLPVVLAGVGIGISFLLLKQGYVENNFVTGLVWSRLGIFFGGISLLFSPILRRQIFDHSRETKSQPGKVQKTSILFLLSKTSAGLGSFCIVYAVSLGSVSFVQALSGMQYVFLLCLAIPLSLRFPKVFDEKLSFSDWVQKIGAIVLIGIGLWLATQSGVTLFL